MPDTTGEPTFADLLASPERATELSPEVAASMLVLVNDLMAVLRVAASRGTGASNIGPILDWDVQGTVANPADPPGV